MASYKVPKYTVKLVRDRSAPVDPPRMTTEVAVSLLRQEMDDLPHEEVWVLFTDARCRITGKVKVGHGGAQGCGLLPGDILRPAIVHNARAIILAHNHPSGDPAPSSEDIELTKRVRAACDVIGVALLDHIIVAEDGHASFFSLGLLD